MGLKQVISQGLDAQRVLDQPKQELQTTVLSIYAPVALVEAFKQVCNVRGEKHSVVARRLLATYIVEVEEELA
jgi:hypothetical protein